MASLSVAEPQSSKSLGLNLRANVIEMTSLTMLLSGTDLKNQIKTAKKSIRVVLWFRGQSVVDTSVIGGSLVSWVTLIWYSFPRCLCDMLGVVDRGDSGQEVGAGVSFWELVAGIKMRRRKRRRGMKSDLTSSSHLLLAHFGVLLTADA